MITKFIFESGCGMTPARQTKLIDAYHRDGVLKLPEGYIVRSIQGFPPDPQTDGEGTTLIIIGK